MASKNLAQRQLVVQIDARLVEVFHVAHRAAAALAQIHQAAHILGGRVDVRVHKRLLGLGDARGVGVVRGVFDHLHGAVRQRDAVLHAGGRGDDVEVEFALEALADDLKVQQAQKAAAEAEA